MSTDNVSTVPAGQTAAPVPVFRYRHEWKLQNGDKMSREEFHRLYEQTAENFKAELIGGTVHVSSPLYPGHGKPHLQLGMVVGVYEGRTPGVDASDNTTIMLGDEGEPQPDLYLRILPEFGGQSTTGPNECVVGAPELIIEIANSSRAIDLHAKKLDYARYGVKEYLVHCVEEKQLRWFDLANGNELDPEADGIIRINNFPGLWIDSDALGARDSQKLIHTLEAGLTSPEHAAFVAELAKRRVKS